jgi:hypothetical protein
MAGELEVGVETERAFMNNFWKNLESPALGMPCSQFDSTSWQVTVSSERPNPAADGQRAPSRDPSKKADVTVDGKTCAKLASLQDSTDNSRARFSA